MSNKYPKRWTRNVIGSELEARGFWLAVEGNKYQIFRGHALEYSGDKQHAILFILADDLISDAERRAYA